ncbi:YfjD [Bacillus subtilis]|nr:YfjD [Bacillus subtilis]
MKNQEIIEVKSKMFLRIWAFVGSAGYGISMFVALLYGYYVSNEILPISHSCWLSVHLVLFIFIYHLLSGFHPAGKYHFPHQDRKKWRSVH